MCRVVIRADAGPRSACWDHLLIGQTSPPSTGPSYQSYVNVMLCGAVCLVPSMASPSLFELSLRLQTTHCLSDVGTGSGMPAILHQCRQLYPSYTHKDHASCLHWQSPILNFIKRKPHGTIVLQYTCTNRGVGKGGGGRRGRRGRMTPPPLFWGQILHISYIQC